MANEIKPPQVEPPIMLKPLRRNPLWRLLGWGGVACLALVAVVLTGQTEAGSRRLRLALDGSAEPAAVAALPRAGESSAETRRLARKCTSSPPTATGSMHASPPSSTISRT